jgi:polyisoprenoid-binding protein YceI
MLKTLWIIDAKHSEIGFKEKYMMFTSVTGKLNNFAALLEKQVDIFENTKVKFNGKIKSISSKIQENTRDRAETIFSETNRFPSVTFTATSFDRIDEVNYKLTGDLDILDVKKTVILDTEFSGLLRDPWGKIKAAFNISGKINKKDWGLSQNSGGESVSDEIQFNMELFFIKKNPSTDV